MSSEGLDSFPDEIRMDVEGLAYLGQLEDSFEFCGHHFSIHTLKGEEELVAGVVTKEYLDTMGQSRAWAWAHVGMALSSVDGDENFCPPIGPDVTEFGRARLRYVTSRWYWPLAEFLFSRLAALNQRQTAAFEALRDLSTGSLPTSQPSAGSLSDLGISEEDLAQEDSTQSS